MAAKTQHELSADSIRKTKGRRYKNTRQSEAGILKLMLVAICALF
jgi:hypothetical protein